MSGGHTVLVEMRGPGRYRLLGQTLDDAAGEAYDKVARYLGLGYPGGPAIDRVAADGDPTAFAFPRALADDGYDFSFSGLKTAVVRTVDAPPRSRRPRTWPPPSSRRWWTCWWPRPAGRWWPPGRPGLCLAGGVAANSLLRRRVAEAGQELGVPTYLPSRAMCTDNAAMVAAAGWWRLDHDGPSPLSLAADPNLFLPLIA